MPCWYFDKKELRRSPSIMQGMSIEDEVIHRREGARFILQIGNKMGLRYETMATGVVYFHRFYMVHSFQEFPRHVTACCCLFLAGKVEETPKKCKDIMKTARGLIDDIIWAEFGIDPREEVMTLERILLQTIKFDFIVEHPYSYLLKYAKCLKGEKKMLQQLVQMAWTFINDGLCTTLCLQWEPEVIAIALLYLAGKLNKFEVTDWQGRNSKHNKWWDMFVQGVSMELLDKICHQVLDLYSPHHKRLSSTPIETSSNQKQRTDSPAKKKPSPSTSPEPPPSKKMKKEEKSSSPVKSESTTPTSFPQYSTPTPYSYPPQNYPGYVPPPHNVTASDTPSRFSFPAFSSAVPPPQSTSMTHSTPHSNIPGAPQVHTSHTPIPSSTPYNPSRYNTPTQPPETPSSIPTHYSNQSPISRYSAQHPPPFHPSSTAPHFPPPPQSHRPQYQGGSYYPPTNTPSFLNAARHTPNRTLLPARPPLHREGGGNYGSSQQQLGSNNNYQQQQQQGGGGRPYYPPAN